MGHDLLYCIYVVGDLCVYDHQHPSSTTPLRPIEYCDRIEKIYHYRLYGVYSQYFACYALVSRLYVFLYEGVYIEVFLSPIPEVML